MWRDRFLAAWRTAVQAGFALVLVWLANRGLRINEQWAGLVEIAAIGAGAGIWAAGTHWLQTRNGGQWWARAARAVGTVLLLGAAAPPAYPPPAPPATTRQ